MKSRTAHFFRSFIPGCFLIPALSAPLPAFAISYGIYDTRGLAMGGTTVAIAKTHQAQYYNPALLAFHEGDEESTQDGRFIFPSFVLLASKNTDQATAAIEDRLDANLSNAINNFNASATAENANNVAVYARDLENVLQELVEDELNVELFTGLAVTEPSDWQGGAFYFGFRLIGLGATDISQEDLALLNTYIEGMQTLASGGSTADLPSEIVDGDGNLIDPTENFNSSADFSVLGLAEWGVAVSKSFDTFGQKLSVGLTPKVLRATAYREYTEFDTEASSYEDNKRTYTSINFDIGVAAHLGDHFRVGLAVKDVIPESYESGSGLELQIRPRTRFGMAWIENYYSVGIDYDVEENAPIAGELPTQDASLGVEITPIQGLGVQLGYKQDLTGYRDDIFSGGIAYKYKRINLEASYAKSSYMQGVSMQIGWSF